MSGIIIVDDEALIIKQVEEYLNLMGYEVAGSAVSGEEAIEQARRFKPDLILMDIVMPGKGGIDGITASEKIVEEMDIPIIFMTAYGDEKIIDRAKIVKPFGFILKPFQENELRAAIEFALYRKKMEKKLKESEEKYRIVVDTAIEAIITIDINMHIVFWNRAAEMMFGYSTEEVQGKYFTSLIPERFHKSLQTEMDRMVLTEELSARAKMTECIGLRKDASEFPMEFSLASWIVREEIFFTIIARDITERKKIEQMKSDFVSLVSHQLKTPVAGIMGCVDNMLTGLTGKITDKQKEYLLVMQEISSRNYRIINNLLNVSRIERGVVSVEIQPIHLSEIIDFAVRDYRENISKKGLILNLKYTDDEIIVLADKDTMVEALRNVIDNAVKFTDEGSISIKTKRERKFGIINVVDAGQGISNDLLKILFTKDQILMGAPTTEGGCGLGLYIAKEFMKLQHGDVAVTSTIGKGSSVIFKIPLAGGDVTKS